VRYTNTSTREATQFRNAVGRPLAHPVKPRNTNHKIITNSQMHAPVSVYTAV
jgi:hypothetical protein